MKTIEVAKVVVMEVETDTKCKVLEDEALSAKKLLILP